MRLTIKDIERDMRVRVRSTGQEFVVKKITCGFSTNLSGKKRLVELVGETRLYKATELEAIDG